MINRNYYLLVSITLLFLLISSLQALAQVGFLKNTVLIQLAGKYDKSPVDSIVYSTDPHGFFVKTKDGRGHFLNWNEARDYVGIARTKEGFLLPRNARITYFDGHGIPNGPYQKDDYKKANTNIFPLPIKAFQMRYGASNSPEPLWLIDEKEASKQEAMLLDPETIKAVDMLVGDNAIKRYGNKAKDGAISISLKSISSEDTVMHNDIMTSFPGGLQAWRHFIDTSIRYPEAAQKAGRRGNVKVSMVIEKDGSVSATPITSFGYGLEEEAIRVIQLSPKWIPASRDGRPITIRFIQSIGFDLR